MILEQTKTYFQEHKIELFKEKQLLRHIKSAKYQFEQKFFQSICDCLTTEHYYLIDQILTEKDFSSEDAIIELSELKKDIPGARLKHVDYAIEKINFLSKIKLPKSVLDNVSRKLLLKYYDRIMALSPSNICEFSPTAKYAIMAIFFHIKLQLMLDGLTDTFIKLTHRMRTKADKLVEKKILQDVKRVDGKFDILEKLAIATVKHPRGIIEEKVYTQVTKDKLIEVIDDLKHRGKWYQQEVQSKIYSNYVHGNRGILLSLLRLFNFKADHDLYEPIIEAINFINAHWDESDSPYYLTHPPIENVIPTNWKSMVVTRLNRKKVINKPPIAHAIGIGRFKQVCPA